MTTLIQSHNYTINLNNVCYFRQWIQQHELKGTIFTMNTDKVVTITCPYDKVVEQLGKRMPNYHIIKLDY